MLLENYRLFVSRDINVDLILRDRHTQENDPLGAIVVHLVGFLYDFDKLNRDVNIPLIDRKQVDRTDHGVLLFRPAEPTVRYETFDSIVSEASMGIDLMGNLL